MSRWLCLIAGVIGVATLVVAADDAPTTVKARIKTADSVAVFYLDDVKLVLDTKLGRVKFMLSDLVGIDKIDEDLKCVLKTRRGDVWHGKLKTTMLTYRQRDKAKFFDLREIEPEYIFLRKADQVVARTKSARLLSAYEDDVRISLDDLTVKFSNQAGDWLVPLGCLEHFFFAAKEDEDDNDNLSYAAVIKFCNGRQLKSSKDAASALMLKDGYGNRLKVEPKGLLAIYGPKVMEHNEVEEGAKALKGSRLDILFDSGFEESIDDVPMTVWSVKSSLGSVLLPDTLLNEIVMSDGSNYVTTVHGDRLYGRIAPSSLKVPADDDELESIRMSKIDRIGLNPVVSASSNCLFWAVENGSVFRARFASTNLDVVAGTGKDKEDLTIKTSDILEIQQDEDERGSLYVWRKGKPRLSVRPKSQKVPLVLLVNNMKHDIAWTDVQGVLFGAPPEDDVSSGPDEGAKFELQTKFGDIELDRSLVSRMVNDKKASVSSFVTVYGEAFSADLIRDKKMIEMLGIEDEDAAEDDEKKGAKGSSELPRNIDLGHPMKSVPRGWLAWRLESLDVFYARIVDDELSISVDETGEDKVYQSAAVDGVSRGDAGEIGVLSDGRWMQGKPEKKKVTVELLATGDEVELSWGMVESVRKGRIASMPPPVGVRMGASPFQLGMVSLSAASFMRGSDDDDALADEKPRSKISLSAFHMDACEVTFSQFEAFVDDSGYETDAEQISRPNTWRTPGFPQDADDPVTVVSWRDAAEFCNWRSRKAGLAPCYKVERNGEVVSDISKNGYRLPTETEWEYAARAGGKDIRYPWDADGDKEGRGNSDDGDSWRWTCPVKTFAPNELGLFGMGGNVWEWCQDWYFKHAYSSRKRGARLNPCVNMDDAVGLTRRVMRGGSYKNGLDMLRCTSRGNGLPLASSSHVGFRCARNSEEG